MVGGVLLPGSCFKKMTQELGAELSQNYVPTNFSIVFAATAIAPDPTLKCHSPLYILNLICRNFCLC